MSDIVDRLRDPINQDIPFTELMLEAAARIEQLEAALREIADFDTDEDISNEECMRDIARQTLRGMR